MEQAMGPEERAINQFRRARTSFPINWILILKTTEKNELSWIGVI